ncbi:MAG: phenylacetaldoxime dehydratase family protein [Pseudomonadota bacterium]
MGECPFLENAIPDHLLVTRSRQMRVPESYRPASKSYSARFNEGLTNLVVVYAGVVFGEDKTRFAETKFTEIGRLFSHKYGPAHLETGTSRHPDGRRQRLYAAYFRDHADYLTFRSESGFDAFFADDQRLTDGVGYVLETLKVPLTRVETIFGDETPEGAAHLASAMSGLIREHAYWGSARDRLAVSQTDYLEPEESPSGRSDFASGEETNGRIVLDLPKNACLVRFGQDLSDADANERELFDTMIAPHLATAMSYLSEKGERLGCLMNREVAMDADRLVAETAPLKTYSMSVWKSLSHLERWAESHHTHLSIFVAAMKYFGRLRGQHKLRIYHELFVFDQGGARFEYINCEPSNGLLNSI